MTRDEMVATIEREDLLADELRDALARRENPDIAVARALSTPGWPHHIRWLILFNRLVVNQTSMTDEERDKAVAYLRAGEELPSPEWHLPCFKRRPPNWI